MGFSIVLRNGNEVPIRGMADPFGLTFDDSGDFDELIDDALSPRLARIDPQGVMKVGSSDAIELLGEVEQLLAAAPENAKGRGRNGQAWRGLNRFRVMLDLCRADSQSTLESSWTETGVAAEPIICGPCVTPDDRTHGSVHHGLVSFPCPCCGYLTFGDSPGSYEICEICFWEDDPVQLRWPEMPGGANKVSLIEAQQSFASTGPSEDRVQRYVRSATSRDHRDDGWRPVSLAEDSFEEWPTQQEAWPSDLTALYWWRPSFWRATR